MNRVILSPGYYNDPTIGRPVSLGYIYVGEIDKDPENFPTQASVLQEDGNVVLVAQPIRTNQGGSPTYNGSTVTILVSGNYSLKVKRSDLTQAYYIPRQVDFIDADIVNDMLGLMNLTGQFDGDKAAVTGFFATFPQSSFTGGGTFVWQSDLATDSANALTVFDPASVGAFDGTLSTLPTFITDQNAATGGTGCWVLEWDGVNLFPSQSGSVSGDSSAGAITANNSSLNNYVKFCVENNTVQNYNDGSFFYSQTLDMTVSSARLATAVGNTEDSNNTGVYSLIYSGAGSAIKCKSLLHTNLGVAGTENVTDSIPATSVGIEASESVQHWGGNIRNFNKGYEINGGFYHNFKGGRMNRCRTLWDYTGNASGIYNSTFDTQNTDFVNGIIADGGDGPVQMGGSWERWTGTLVTKTAGDPEYKIVLDGPYIENYPNNTVAAGLTGNDLDKYTAPRCFFSANGSISGFASVVCSGITSEIILSSVGLLNLNTDIDLYGGTTPPTRLISSPFVIDCDAKFGYTNANFAAVPVFAGGASSSNSTGTYTNPDGTIGVFDGDSWNVLTLENTWANATNVKLLSYKVINDILYIQGSLNGGAATAEQCATLPTALLSRIPDLYVYFPVNNNTVATRGRILTASGGLRIELLAVNDLSINVAIPLK